MLRSGLSLFLIAVLPSCRVTPPMPPLGRSHPASPEADEAPLPVRSTILNTPVAPAPGRPGEKKEAHPQIGARIATGVGG